MKLIKPAHIRGNKVMKKLSTFILLIAGIACGAPPVMAETAASATGHANKKSASKKVAAAHKHEAQEIDEKEPDTSGLQPIAFNCELGNKITIYSRTNDDQQIALHWNKHTHLMTRVGTTTGAQRFENAQSGLVWIGIPAKGMLLDSKHGRQLANECRNADQAAQKVAEKS
ncbi:hypothetical protein [Noviherbaspirillum sp.]|uniref:hypothetical protein n=1 Tax=Noviherbaspirillum sp. TaxID=1926288 RepID=UPI002B46FF9A|nr:hypothetical protein [Noviherbaspirillum sp.]HJV81537.1 hypothetical protein [Noviherbaspirillum sp.]